VHDRHLPGVLGVAALAAAARAIMVHGLELYSDEAYYWLWSRRPALGYFDHPPMVAWLVRLSSPLLPGEAGVRLLFFLCGGLAVVFAALAARELSEDPRAALLAALLAATAPLLTLTGALALPDAPVEAAYAAATWLVARARGRGWLAAAVPVGLALLSKYTAALLAPALFLLVAWDRDLRAELRRPWPWAAALLATAIFAPCLAWNARHDFVSIRFQLQHGFGGGFSAPAFLEYCGAIALGLGPAPAALGIAFLARPRTSAARRVAAATLLPLAVTTASALRGPVEANWAALVYPGLCAAAAAALCRMRRPVAVGVAAASMLLGLALAVGFAVEVRRPRLAPPASPVVERLRGWREFAARTREAAEKGCAAIGSPRGCDGRDPFAFTFNYQQAGELAFYAGWRRFGPAQEGPRASQLDLWDETPAPGAPFLYVGIEGLDDEPRRVWRGEGRGPTVSFDVRFHGEVLRTGSVTPFSRFLGLERRRLAGLQSR
jgi:hypothetical protein